MSLNPDCAVAFLGLSMKLERERDEARDALATAQLTIALIKQDLDATAQLTIALIKQDLDTIREICMNAGTSTDVLKFLDTPTNNEQ